MSFTKFYFLFATNSIKSISKYPYLGLVGRERLELSTKDFQSFALPVRLPAHKQDAPSITPLYASVFYILQKTNYGFFLHLNASRLREFSFSKVVRVEGLEPFDSEIKSFVLYQLSYTLILSDSPVFILLSGTPHSPAVF